MELSSARPSIRHPDAGIAALRIVVGLWFARAITAKLTWSLWAGVVPVPRVSERWINFLGRRLAEYAGSDPPAWYKAFLLNTAIPHTALFAHLTAIGEIAVGIGLTLGLLTVLSSLGGLWLIGNYFIAALGMGLQHGGLPYPADRMHGRVHPDTRRQEMGAGRLAPREAPDVVRREVGSVVRVTSVRQVPRYDAFGALLVAGLLVGGCQVDTARRAQDESGAQLPAPGRRSGAPLAYVPNEGSGDITVIDTGTDSVVATIFVGKRPRGTRVSPDGKTVYVALSGSAPAPPGTDPSKLTPPDRSADGIGVVDVALHKLKGKLPSGPDPEQFAISPDGSKLYISNEDAATASVVDVANGRVLRTIPVGVEPEGVNISPDGKLVYVSAETDHNVTVINTDSNRAIASFNVGKRPRGIAFSPDGARAYVTAELGGTVSVVSTADSRVIGTIKIDAPDAKPMGIVVSPDGRRVYVSTGRGGTVVVIDPSTERVIGTIPVGGRPWGIAMSADGRKLYTANGPPVNYVAVVDLAKQRVVATVKAGNSPWGVAIAP